MSIVFNVFQILLLLIGFFLYFLGIGIAPFLLLKKEMNINKNDNLLQLLALFTITGILINYSLGLIFKSLSTTIRVSSAISISGLLIFAFYSLKSKQLRIPSKNTLLKIFCAILLLFLFFSPSVAEPLIDWDARSIWFFHAKMIYVAGTIDQSAGWNHPSILFSHPDYPKLVPFIASQINYALGYWNEYLPKVSVLFMLTPMVLLLFSISKLSVSFIFLISLIPFSFYNTLWNGYMDGLLAFYLSISLLFIGKFFSSSRLIDLVTGFMCLAIAVNIKNEGALGTLAVITSLLIVVALTTPLKIVKEEIVRKWKYFAFSIVGLFFPFLLWNYNKSLWNLSNDLGIGSSQSLKNIVIRLSDGSYKFILNRTLSEISGFLIILIIVLISLNIWKIRIGKEELLSLMVSGIITLGFIVIYLLTPHDLAWHINTSINRTLLSTIGAIIIACYFMIKKIENR